jgi:hypothetical protein
MDNSTRCVANQGVARQIAQIVRLLLSRPEADLPKAIKLLQGQLLTVVLDQVIVLLIRRLSHTDSEIRQRAALALESIGGPAVMWLGQAAAATKKISLRVEIMQVLRRIGPAAREQVILALCAAFKTQQNEPTVRTALQKALEELGPWWSGDGCRGQTSGRPEPAAAQAAASVP